MRLGGSDELLSLLDVLGQPDTSVRLSTQTGLDLLGQSSLEELLLFGGKLAKRKNLLDTLGTELDVGGEPFDTLRGVQWGFDEGGLDDTGFSVKSSDQRVGESCSG